MLHSLESTTQMQEPMSSLGIQNGLVKQSRDTGPSEAWVRIPGHRCLEVRDRIRIRIPGLFSVCSSDSPKGPWPEGEKGSGMQLRANELLLCPQVRNGKMPDSESGIRATDL